MNKVNVIYDGKNIRGKYIAEIVDNNKTFLVFIGDDNKFYVGCGKKMGDNYYLHKPNKVKDKKIAKKFLSITEKKYKKRKLKNLAILLALLEFKSLLFPVQSESISLAYNFDKNDNEEKIKTETLVDESYEEEVKQELKLLREIKSTFKEPVIKDEVEIDCEDLFSSPRAQNTLNKYQEKITKYANLYGLDPEMVLAMATQERGEHSSNIDKGGALGLMQIQYKVWVGKTISAYKLNEATGKYEQINLTLTDSFLRSLDGSIEAGCAIWQLCINLSNNNILAGIQMYNMGNGAVNDAIDNYAYETNQTREEVLNNKEDIGWLKYCANKSGDPNYLENVVRWMPNNSEVTVTDPETYEKTSILIKKP